MDIKYLEMFNEIEKISSKDFLKEKNKINFFNVSEFSDDQAFMNYRMDGSIYNQFINMYDGYAETRLYLLEECMKNRTSSKSINNFTVKMSNLYIWLLKIYQVCAKFNFYVEDYFIND